MNAKFEKWCEDEGLSTEVWKNGPYYEPRTQEAWEGWKGAIQSLEVTQELVEIGFSATDQLSRVTRRDIDQALTAVISALKEQAK